MKKRLIVYTVCLLIAALSLTLGACRGDENLMGGTEEWTYQPCEKHDDGEWIVEKEPTKTEEGKKVLACTKCGEVLISVTLPVLEPETTATPETENNAATVSCDHDHGEWAIIKEPTETENGKKQLKCTKCGHVLISVPILPTGSETSTTSDAP